jgi:hypothetical protein
MIYGKLNNTELASKLIEQSGNSSKILQYLRQYGTKDIEVILTRLDIDAITNGSMRLDRLAIEAELASYFRNFRFSTAALKGAPWLSAFATDVLGQDDAIISLNYDCFLEGLLDHSTLWSPNDGYYGVDNILIEAKPNPNGIVIYKIHGSEHFRVSNVTDRPEQEAIAYEFNENIFPVSAAHCHFGGGIDSRPYLIAPSFVKLRHRQIALMMLRILELTRTTHNLVIVGCGLCREDNFLWLLLSHFLKRKDEKRLVLVDPAAESIYDRIYRYWIGDPRKYTHVTLLDSGLESSYMELSSLLKNK